MIKWAIGAVIALLIVGGGYWQHRAIQKLQIENAIISSNLKALETERAKDSAKLSAQIKARAALANELERKRDDETNDFLRLPIPGGLRESLENYLNKKAPG